MLCIDTRVLKSDQQNVQKDVDLEDLLLNHTRHYDSVEEALKDKYVPLDFSVSVRSMKTNLVVESDKVDKKLYYVNMTNIDQFVHKGYDLVMFLCSLGMLQCVDYRLGFDDLMMKHSQFMPVGIYVADPMVINPIIYSHVIMSDEGVEYLAEYLKSDRKLVSISDMCREGNIPAMIDTLVIVDGGKENE